MIIFHMNIEMDNIFQTKYYQKTKKYYKKGFRKVSISFQIRKRNKAKI